MQTRLGLKLFRDTAVKGAMFRVTLSRSLLRFLIASIVLAFGVATSAEAARRDHTKSKQTTKHAAKSSAAKTLVKGKKSAKLAKRQKPGSRIAKRAKPTHVAVQPSSATVVATATHQVIPEPAPLLASPGANGDAMKKRQLSALINLEKDNLVAEQRQRM